MWACIRLNKGNLFINHDPAQDLSKVESIEIALLANDLTGHPINLQFGREGELILIYESREIIVYLFSAKMINHLMQERVIHQFLKHKAGTFYPRRTTSPTIPPTKIFGRQHYN
ncbi:hypothetical protein KC845_01000 [Candidatus Kaiserbacteria bacterium]|nr:hypothetical protein [Candidatus Kaiserbacteria bacterium]